MELKFHFFPILCLIFQRRIECSDLCSEPKLENAHIVCGKHNNHMYYLKDEVSFVCNFGYKTSQMDILKTQCKQKRDGTLDWTPIHLTCGPVYCGKPEDVENGYYEGVAPIVGSEIKYHCNKGYYLNGFSKRTCLPDKTWSGWPPTCEIIKCWEPSLIENGDIRYEGPRLTYLSLILYTCQNGFVLEGSKTRQCNEFGQFTGIEPKCVVADCGQPQKPENGKIEKLEGTKWKNRVEYSCDERTTIEGSAVATCTFENQMAVWSPQPPLCNPIICLEPSPITNGEIRYEDDHLKYLAFIHYTCDSGFVLEGPTIRQCNELGEFTGDEPKCVEIDCGQPEKPGNGTIKYLQETKWMSVVEYSCDDRTTIDGQSTATCKFENKIASWSPQPPLCIQHCYVSNIEHANFQHLQQTIYPGHYLPHRETIKMACDVGHEVENSDTNEPIIADCEDGKWSDQIKCSPARCRPSDDVDEYLRERRWSTRELPKIVNSGEQIRLKCMTDYPEKDEDGFLGCYLGDWQLPDSELKCRKKSCDVSHVRFQYGVVLYNEEQVDDLKKIHHDEFLELSCSETSYDVYINGKLGHSSYVQCIDGELSAKTFQCRPGSCECMELRQKLADKGMEPVYCSSRIPSGRKIDLECSEGFSDASVNEVECDTKRWLIGADDGCKRKCDCSSLDIHESIKLRRKCVGSVSSGESLEWDCAVSYFEVGEISCTDGEWLATGYCLAPCLVPNIPNSVMSTIAKGASDKSMPDKKMFYEEIRIKCIDGYNFDDDDEENEIILQCSDGQIGRILPKCIRKITSSSEETTTLRTTNADFDSEEIEATSSPSSSTSRDGDDVLFRRKCTYEPKDKNLLAFLNGQQLSDSVPASINVNETIIFRCIDIGRFSLDGSNEVTCVHQSWRGQLPSCRPLQLRSVSNAPVITYEVDKGDFSLDFDGTLNIHLDSKLSLRCWWFRKYDTPKWKLNEHEINFDGVEQSWRQEEYFELTIDRIKSEHEGYFTCTTPYKKTHGIKVKVKIPNQRTTKTPSTTPTTTATTTRPMGEHFRDCPRLGVWDNTIMDIFKNGQLMTEREDYFPHTTVLIFRCAIPVKFKMVGNRWKLSCNNGTWNWRWPQCEEIFKNNDWSYPPIEYRSTVQRYRLDNGDYWIDRKSKHSFLCYYGSEKLRPQMTLNGMNMNSVSNKGQTAYDHYKKCWFLGVGENFSAPRMIFRCTIPHTSHSNTVNVVLLPKCELNENDLRTFNNIQVVPSSRRYPFYTYGNEIELRCAERSNTSIPSVIHCGDAGEWMKSKTQKQCR